MKKKMTLQSVVWKAARGDLLLGIPWLPIYSASEVLLGIFTAILLRLIFVNESQIKIIDLIPGQLKNYFHYDYIFERKDLIFLIPILIVIASFIKLISSFMSSYLTERAGHRVAHKLREKMLSGFLSSHGNILDKKDPDYIANQMMQDTSLLQGAISKGTIGAVRDSLVLVGIIISMLLISWQTFLIGIAFVIPIGFALKAISKKLNYYTRESQNKQIEISTRLLLSHHGALTVHALRSQEREKDDFENLNAKNYKLMKNSLFVRTFFPPATEFIAIMMLTMGYIWKMSHVNNFQSTTYTSMLILLAFSFRYIKNIAGTITFFSDIQVVIKRVSSYFKDYAEQNQNQRPAVLSSNSKEAIKLENISYQLSDKELILKQCSINIPKGKKVAFLGESGAGKTTLLRIMAGLVIPSHGKVSIMENFLLASQHPYLFRGKVRENIVYVEDKIPESVAQSRSMSLVQSLRLAFSEIGASLFLEKNLGFLGDGLSGGEKARVALGRLLFATPKLILLDEPTANLDSESAKLFWDVVNDWKAKDPDHTLVAVSHALHEIQNFDYLFIFHKGVLIKEGIPKDILDHV